MANFKVSSKISLKSTSTKFALVNWIYENSYSVEPRESVLETDMLTNPEMSGPVKYSEGKENEPRGGWQKCPAKIIATSGKYMFF